MPPLLLYAVLLFTLALLLYSVSVWSEWLSKEIKTWHLAVFGVGVLVDIAATLITIKFVGAIVFTPHAIFGFTSLVLMIIHLIWATLVFFRGRYAGRKGYNRLSLVVWSVWLTSYITGFVSGIQRLV